MSNDKLPWFRLYTEAVDDEKLRLLAFEDRWHYVAILCCKGQGILDEDNDALRRRKIAVKLGVQVRELEEIARRLSEVGLVDQETLQPCGWCKRLFASDNSTERVRRYREKPKNQADSESNGAETLQQRSDTVAVTPAETDTDTDKGTNVPSSGSGDPAPSALRCPHQDIIALYHDILPELPAIVVSRWPESKDSAALRARWKEDARHRSMEFWERFFTAVRTNPHWMGENASGWQANLRGLVKRSSFDKVLDRRVDNARREARHG